MVARSVDRLSAALPVKITFRPSSLDEDLAAAATEYGSLWAEHGETIARCLEDLTRLRFSDETLDATVYEGPSGSHPLRLRASYDRATKLGTLVHELAHRIIAGHVRQVGADSTLASHEIIDLFLFDAWTELFGNTFACRQVEIESRRRAVYAQAWRTALELDRQARAQRLRELIVDATTQRTT